MEEQQAVLGVDIRPVLIKKGQAAFTINPGKIKRKEVGGDLVMDGAKVPVNQRYRIA